MPQHAPRPRVPDAIEPRLGYRAWVASRESRMLLSLFRPVAWPFREPLEAVCLPDTPPTRLRPKQQPSCPQPPAEKCLCGVWGRFSLRSVLDWLDPYRAVVREDYDLIFGIVWGWGRLEVGPLGWRAQRVRPAAILEHERPLPLLKSIGAAYSIPVVEDGRFRVKR